MSSVPSETQAVVVRDGPRLSHEKIATPKPGPHQVVVKISDVAQNPTDVQSFDKELFGDGAVLGCDFAGTVVSTGDKVSKLKNGDQVAGLIWGGEIQGLGAYSEYTLADENISFKIPSKISPAEAATVPLAALTAWLSLFSKGCLDIPRRSSSHVLVWGGSSSVGQYAIQLAALQGLKVVTTCSPKNFDLMKRLGADAAISYRDDDAIAKIRDAAPDLMYIFDTIGSLESSTTAAKCVAQKGKLCTVRPGKANTENVPKSIGISDVLVWTAFLKDHQFGDFFWPASQEDHELSIELCEALPQLLESGKILPNEVLKLNGLQDLPKGFDLYRKGAYSAQKVVYSL